jgi:hypothetical protein
LFGAFLSLKDKEEDEQQRNAWTFNGRIHFIADKKQKIPLTVTFSAFPGEGLRQALIVLGFTWNDPEQRWEGYGDAEELRNLLEPHGSVVGEQ